ncbi:hypothetical protein [Xanthomonas sp. MUS 060]|uniref:hypothetical protein n=1 Tax=Xanthomonas sp. MUS 060 TaxID=1588031 RepID=UPI000B150F25|nr:hypothetical protein [Xanthomonas sp. MUS 060]
MRVKFPLIVLSGVLALVAAGDAFAGTEMKAGLVADQDHPEAEGPYIEQIGSECMMVNTYLQQHDGVSKRVVLREPVECADQQDGRSLAKLAK